MKPPSGAAVSGPRGLETRGAMGPALVVGVFGALVFAGFPASLAFQSASPSAPLSWAWVAGCSSAGVVAALLAVWAGAPVLALWRAVLGVLRGRLWMALVAGLVLRLVWVVTVQPAPASDGAAYLSLAQGLLTHGEFRAGPTRAYWPPGMAFALLPFLAALPSAALAVAAFGLVFFVVGALGTYSLARRLGLDDGAAVAAVWLAALWPAHVMLAGLPEKELIVIALMPWALRWSCDALQRWPAAAAAGLLVGAMMLVQPSLQLLPVLAAAVALLLRQPFVAVLRAAVLAVLAMLLVVTPWSMRNLRVLGHPVLVSTNGGSNLYRANNELATGAFVAAGKVDVESLPELEGDRVGKRLAVEWVRSRPLDFLRLCATRVLLFPGDQSYPAYAAFRADPDRLPRLAYLGLKATAALPWLLLWVAAVHGVGRVLRRAAAAPPLPWLLLLPTAYLTAIHAVFESGTKYHLPTLLPVLVLLVLLCLGRGAARKA